ncbi:uncharacterized protein Cngl isoform X2 [Venturia canescens]|uniref:uncharacterized protein Cngl isoform X2 n=1 Tax=Venturia canescens TaxID=32260 RepID=UPI001C9D196B|nr:uncharacterized protein LOC122406007 isoform X2 [Venturia canescens]
MKLSVSAYRAQASAHKKILCNYQHQLSYGATSQASSSRTHSDPAAILSGLKVDRAENEEAQEGGLGTSTVYCAASGSRMGSGPDSGSSAPSSEPRSIAISRDRGDDEEEKSGSGRRSNGHGGSRSSASASRRGSCTSANETTSSRQVSLRKSFSDGLLNTMNNSTISDIMLDSNDSGSPDTAIPTSARCPRMSRGSQKWNNVRAAMALYSSLRKIKRTKSNQRWMKLRTTVQLSSAISTVQKKPPLKREDSFLKRFSTRQIPESQETLDTGEGEGDPSNNKDCGNRGRRPRTPQKPPKTVINPDENFYYYWLMILSSCVLYNLWTLIVRQSFPELQAVSPTTWLICDCFTDLIFFFDVGVQFRTGYLEQGLMVYNNKKLAGHYLKSRSFILDLLALLPLDLLQFNLGSNPMLRFPRFLKIYRLYNYYYMVESRTVYPNLWRVLNLIHILLILAHWFGCFYYLLSQVEGFQGDWVYPYRPGDYATLTRKYLGSLYWATLTLTTIGDLPTPETNAEYVFTIVSYLIGVFIFATIVGQVGNVITNRNANRLEFERLLDGAKTYMRHHKVSGGMKRRVLRWYDYSWSRGRIQGGGDINTALGLLPDKLKTELALHVNLSVLKKVTIFQECQPEFLHDLVLKMKAYIFTPGDSICRKGEVAREMFIIADGILEVISETGRVLTTMKAGDFFGEIGILNLDGLNKRTADVRSVGYSELFSLSREDVLAAMKDYPEAQEILQNLGRKRLMEAQRVARAYRMEASSGHDSDNSTGKRIVDKLKNDVKGLKNVWRKSRRNTRPEESLELQPLTPKVPPLKRQTKVDDSHQEASVSNIEAPISPLGAGLPLLSRLRLLKEKQDREENKKLMETPVQASEPSQCSLEPLNPMNQNLPLLQRILLLKAKTETENIVGKEATVKEPLLPKKVIIEEPSNGHQKNQPTITIVEAVTKSPSFSVNNENSSIAKKPWAMLKDASLTVKDAVSPQRSPPTRIPQHKQSLVHIRQRTKMYASVDDLSPEYCGLPFVKKLKILNERQKLAELERAVRSSSLDCGENAEAEFDGNLTRSHSEACAIEYTRRLDKFNKARCSLTSQSDPLSPEDETLERRNLKSILKKLSAGSKTDNSETSTASIPDREKVTMEFKKLMRAPTIEGYAARHSQFSKSVTFNKYTLHSPPSEPTLSNVTSTLEERTQSKSDCQEPDSFEPPNKLSFRPLNSSGDLLQMISRPRDEECLGELVTGIRDVIQNRLEDIQSKFDRQLSSLELEIRKRDEIISQLQARIQELENADVSGCEISPEDSSEPDISMESDAIEACEDHPFMRDGSVDTVLTARPHNRRVSPKSHESSRNRRSWEEHSEEETLELQDLPRSISPQSIWKEDVAICLESNSDESKSEDDTGRPTVRRRKKRGRVESESDNIDDRDESDDDDGRDNDNRSNNWEVEMLAKELEARRRSSEGSSPGS